MAKSTSRLGRGLGSLIAGGAGAPAVAIDPLVEMPGHSTLNEVSEEVTTIVDGPFSDTVVAGNSAEKILEVPLDDLVPNPHQPRKTLDPAKVSELAASIKAEGLLQPIVARKTAEGYEIIAGERRWRAHRELGRDTILVRLVEATDLSSASLSLIENLQREGLNPLEEALGYSSLVNDFSLTQAQVAEKVGKSRTYVTNMMRLLQLDDGLRNLLVAGKLSVGHAKVLLGVEDIEVRGELGARAAREGWNVRQCEDAVEGLRSSSGKTTFRRTGGSHLNPGFREIADRVASRLGVESKVTANGAGKGKLIIPFADEDDLRRIISVFGA
ncbi:MAG: ParB/RepB/Spo0J family partition protein [Opitutae bacterium]|nr:ParB/RepB/Spo0J family partition protein [Opitutae bacterium]